MLNPLVSEQEWVYRIALKMIPQIGDTNARSLLSHCGSAEAVFAEKKGKLMRIPGVGNIISGYISSFSDFERAEQEWEFITRHQIRPYFFTDENYPYRLKECADAPLIFYFKGNADLNHHRMVSIVGTRKATDYGKLFCAALVEALAPHEVIVISGLAYGIDIAAHRAALANGVPTVGVLAHGLDMIYPPPHYNISVKMQENGGILSEYMGGCEPEKEHFPDRNRIVAGLSDAVIVVEAAEKGGALITAEYANNYNRDVFALPGRIHDELSAGCNRLIKSNKAALLESADDLLTMMNWDQKHQPRVKQAALFLDLSEPESRIVNVLSGRERVHIDAISAACSIPGSELAILLLNLELNGVITAWPGKFYSKV